MTVFNCPFFQLLPIFCLEKDILRLYCAASGKHKNHKWDYPYQNKFAAHFSYSFLKFLIRRMNRHTLRHSTIFPATSFRKHSFRTCISPWDIKDESSWRYPEKFSLVSALNHCSTCSFLIMIGVRYSFRCQKSMIQFSASSWSCNISGVQLQRGFLGLLYILSSAWLSFSRNSESR